MWKLLINHNPHIAAAVFTSNIEKEEIEDNDPYLMYPDAAGRSGALRGSRVQVRSRHADDALGAVPAGLRAVHGRHGVHAVSDSLALFDHAEHKIKGGSI